MSKPVVVFVLGGPGAGKGTECAKIVKEFGFVHLSAGDLLRDERKNGGETGELIQSYITDGKIIPVAITIGLIKSAMEREGAKGKSKFLIDGFPRNEDNLTGWNELMDSVCDVKFCLFLDTTEEVMQKRLLGRDEGRADDNIESIKKRFATYVESTRPIIDIFDKQGKTRKVDSTGSPDEVHAQCVKIFSELETEMTTLYVLTVSANSHGPMCLAAEAKLDVTTKALDMMKGETRTPEFLAINPFHCCPTIKDGDFSLWESTAVMRYMCNKNNLDNWYPTDCAKRGKVDQILDYRQSDLYKKIGDVAYPALGFTQNTVTDAHKEAIKTGLADFEKHYLSEGKFAGGFDSPTIADLSIRPAIHFLKATDTALSEGVQAYCDRFDKAVASYNDIVKPLDGYLAYLASKK